MPESEQSPLSDTAGAVEKLANDLEKLRDEVTSRAPGLTRDVAERVLKDAEVVHASAKGVVEDARQTVSAVRAEFSEYKEAVRKEVEEKVGELRDLLRGVGKENANLKKRVRDLVSGKTGEAKDE